MITNRYNSYPPYLKEKYGEKVYKISINLPLTCPNRDGTLGVGGCIFCGERGGGLQNIVSKSSITEQITKGIGKVKRKHKANKFIVYFQNFTNTYLPLEQLENYLEQACVDDIVEIAISTRPDCVNDSYLEYLADFKDKKGIEISLELGLQTVNYHSLVSLNRGHTLAEFIDAAQKVRQYNFSLCVHLILNLPWDTMDDVIEAAKILSAVKVNQVKLHSLFILPGTALDELHRKGKLKLISLEEYIERVIVFLQYLDPQIIIQRLIGRSPERKITFVNWDIHWQEIKRRIEEILDERDIYQGEKFAYLNGKALKKAGFLD